MLNFNPTMEGLFKGFKDLVGLSGGAKSFLDLVMALRFNLYKDYKMVRVITGTSSLISPKAGTWTKTAFDSTTSNGKIESSNSKTNIPVYSVFIEIKHTKGIRLISCVKLSLHYWMVNCCCSVAQLCPTLCTPWTTACQAYLSFISWSLLKLMTIESMMPSNYFILCCPLLPLPSIFPSIGAHDTNPLWLDTYL